MTPEPTRPKRPRIRPLPALAGALAALLATPPPTTAAPDAMARVALVVDTSTSLTEPGMDPERTSLLVARLFADIVPGELAVIRLPNLVGDAHLLPSRDTGATEPCPDAPSLPCRMVEPAGDWAAIARAERLGALVRPTRGDADYKQRLDLHLQPTAPESEFQLAFRSAQGFLEDPAAGEAPRSLIWLSDGRPEDAPALRAILAELAADGTRLEAIVFGSGDTSLARQAGLEVRQVRTPAELMAAFADVFRRIVGAPYGIDGLVVDRPSFRIEPNVDEAWVVVYGDASLAEVRLEGPTGAGRADHGSDRHPPAGAYRVAYLRRPAAGEWRIEIEGGGPDAAYAVIQRSALSPVLLAPATAVAGIETAVVAGIRGGDGDELITDPEILGSVRLTIEVDGRTSALEPGGDIAGDASRFGGTVRFETPGRAQVQLRLVSELIDRTVESTVDVTGHFSYAGGPVAIDLGRQRAGEGSCRPLDFEAEHQGALSFRLDPLHELPDGHRMELRVGGERPLVAGRGEAPIAPGSALELCLVTVRSAPSSRAGGEPWLTLAVAGGAEPTQRVPLALIWEVAALGFWERWGKLVLALIVALLALFVLGGYVLPRRFPPALAVTFVPDREELDEQSPQPVRQWRGVGIGFYRHARAFLHPDYRLSGSPRGAVAGLYAAGRSAQVGPGRGAHLFRETVDGDWESVPPAGHPARPGDVYRVGERGPYFRIGSRR